MNKKILFLFTLVLLPVMAVAQHRVEGVVTDADTGEPLPSANILVKGTYSGTITNNDGRFLLDLEELPATLVVRYIGYQSEEIEVTEGMSGLLKVELQPSVLEMDEIVVTDKDPGLSIMELVIERKKLWRDKLENFKADAYTRQKLENDTSIVSITESVSVLFWEKEEGHKEVIKSRNQTSNIAEDQNFAGVNYIPNFYDDNIEIAGFNLVGVTHPDATKFYEFRLLETTKMDEKNVYKIDVIPKRTLQPLFEGTVYVLDEVYALLEVDLKPGRVVNFPPPVQDFNLAYRQQFNNFGTEFWLPVDMRVTGDIRISMIGLRFPNIRFSQVAAISDYEVNTELPDSLFKEHEVFLVDSLSVQDDTLLSVRRVEKIPLTNEEEEAYAEIDSTRTLEKAFRPSGFLADAVMDDDDEDNGNSFLSRAGRFVPDGFGIDVHFNRVDGFHLGGSYERNIIGFEAEGRVAFNTNTEFWDYGGRLERNIVRSPGFRLELTGGYFVDSQARYSSNIYPEVLNTVTAFFGARDYFDYYRSERFMAGFGVEVNSLDLDANVNYTTDYQKSVNRPDVFDYSLFGFHAGRRVNPAIDAGTKRSLQVELGFNTDDYNFGFTGRRQAVLTLEHSADWLGSDFGFTTLGAELDYNITTFFPRRLFSNTLDLRLAAGTAFGRVPHQEFGAVDGSVASFTPFGTIKTLRHLPYEGDEFWLITAEHNFRSVPFEWLGLWELADRGLSLIAFAGAAESRIRTKSQSDFVQDFGFEPRVSGGVHYEAGISLNNIFSIARLDFAKRLDASGFFIGFSVPRIF